MSGSREVLSDSALPILDVEVAIAQGIGFLLTSQTDDGGGWGFRSGDKPDLQCTALALATISEIEEPSVTNAMVRTILGYLIEGYATYDFRALTRDHLLAMLQATGAARRWLERNDSAIAGSQKDQLRRMQARCYGTLVAAVTQDDFLDGLQAMDAARMLFALSAYGFGPGRRSKAAIARLCKYLFEHRIEGAEGAWWSADARHGTPDIASTSMAAAALTASALSGDLEWNDLSGVKVFFTSALVSEMLRDLTESNNLYLSSLILGALSLLRVNAEGVQLLSRWLLLRQNSEQGWGEGSGQPNVEATSYATLALIATVRMHAQSAAVELDIPIGPLHGETATGNTDWQRLVNFESIANLLLERLAEFGNRLAAIELELRSQRLDQADSRGSRNDSEDLGGIRALERSLGVAAFRKSERRTTGAAITGAVIATVVSGVALVIHVTQDFGLWVAITLGSIGLVGLSLVLWAVYNRGTSSMVTELIPSRRAAIATAVTQFGSAIRGIPNEQVEEVLGIMWKRLVGLPQDLFIEEVDRLREAGPIPKVAFWRWMYELAELDPQERGEVLTVVHGAFL